MTSRNPSSWMWAEACEMMERAQRLQRQFFRFGHAVEAQPRWEPPVDIVAYEPDVHVTVALPGVAPERVEVRVANGALYIAALRVPPLGRETTAVHRLEIPYGRFERQVVLPPGRYELLDQGFQNGCLVLRLTKR
jgi:HSP20 family protein